MVSDLQQSVDLRMKIQVWLAGGGNDNVFDVIFFLDVSLWWSLNLAFSTLTALGDPRIKFLRRRKICWFGAV